MKSYFLQGEGGVREYWGVSTIFYFFFYSRKITPSVMMFFLQLVVLYFSNVLLSFLASWRLLDKMLL